MRPALSKTFWDFGFSFHVNQKYTVPPSRQRFCESFTLGTRGFPSMRREFSVLAEGRHIFGRGPKPRAAKPRQKAAFRAGRYKDLTESGNCARKVSGTQGTKAFVMPEKFGKG